MNKLTAAATITVLSRSELTMSERVAIMAWFEQKIATTFQVTFHHQTGPFTLPGRIGIEGLRRGGKGSKLAKAAAWEFALIINRS